MEKEKIIERIYEISEKTHRTELLPETLEQAMSNSKTLFNLKEIETAIFKEIINSSAERGLYTRICEKYNTLSPLLTRMQYKIIDNLFLCDSIARFKKMNNTEKLESDISLLGLDNRTTDLLKSLKCTRVLDIFYLNEKILKNRCIEKRVNYKKIIERLQILEIEQVVKRIFKISDQLKRNRILPETLLEIVGDSEKLYNSSEKYTYIFKQIATTKNRSGMQYQLAKEFDVKHQRISQIYLNMIERMYLEDSIKRFKKLETNEDKLKSSIKNLNLDFNIYNTLTELHCKNVEDIFNIDEDYLRELFMSRYMNYQDLKDRLEALNITNPSKEDSKEKHLQAIEELNIPLKVYRHLKWNHINTTYDLKIKINDLMLEASIPEDIKKLIKDLYNKEIDSINNDQTTLLIQQQQTEESLKKTQFAQEMLQEKIEQYLEYLKHDLAPKEEIIIRKQLHYLLKTVEKNSERISEKEEKLRQFSKTWK